MIEIKQNYSLKEQNSFAFNHKAEFFCEVRSVEESHEFVDYCLNKNMPLKLLGEGTNIVLTRDIKGGVLKVSIPGKNINNNEVDLGAGENWNETVLWSLENQLFGLENLSLIPGTVGAAPVQNIGAYGEEISSKLVSLEAINIKTNELISMTNKECKFSYRESIFKKKDDLMITSIKLKLSKEPEVNTSYNSLKNYLIKDDINPDHATPYQVCRAVTSIRNQILPDFKVEPNVGSFFKNLILDEKAFDKLKKENIDLPHFKNTKDLTYKVPVAFLIEKAGWKGKKQGNVRVSEKHALVLIADKGSNSEQLIRLFSDIAKDIYEKTQVELEVEPKIF